MKTTAALAMVLALAMSAASAHAGFPDGADQATAKGVKFLLSAQQEDGSWKALEADVD